MGEYFIYANLDKREYFSIGALGGATKRSGGCRIVVAGDQAEPGTERRFAAETGSRSIHGLARSSFRDVRTDVALMLLHDDPDAPMEAVEDDTGLLVYLSELALLHACRDVADVLEAHFGTDWRKRYAEARTSCYQSAPLSPTFRPTPLPRAVWSPD